MVLAEEMGDNIYDKVTSKLKKDKKENENENSVVIKEEDCCNNDSKVKSKHCKCNF